MQTTGNLVATTAEFTACMQNGENYGNCRDAQLRLNADRNASAIIGNANNIVRQDLDGDFCTAARQDFVDGVVDDFINQMMQTIDTGGTDIHTRTFSYCVQTFQYLNLGSVILVFHFIGVVCMIQTSFPPILFN